MSDFTLVYDHFDPGTEGLRESLTSTGNGYFCTRGTAEWEDAAGVHYPGTYVHGGFNRETTILGGRPGLELDGSAFGLGTRSQRYAAILEDGVVRQLMVEPDPLAVTVSSVAAVLDAL